MSRTRSILGLALGLALLATTFAANAADEVKKKKDGNATTGVVTAVDKDKDDAAAGTITIKQMGKGKGANAAANATEKKFTYSKDTTFEKIAAKKKKDTASAADVMVDQRVLITSADGKKADKVTILPAAKTATE